jgi:hypothetical protein
MKGSHRVKKNKKDSQEDDDWLVLQTYMQITIN